MSNKKLIEQIYSECIESEDRDMVCHYEVNDDAIKKIITLCNQEALERAERALLVRGSVAGLKENLEALRQEFKGDE